MAMHQWRRLKCAAAAVIAGSCGEAVQAFSCGSLRPAVHVGVLASFPSSFPPRGVQRAATRPRGQESASCWSTEDGDEDDQWIASEVEVMGVDGVPSPGQTGGGAGPPQRDTGMKSARQRRVDAFFEGIDNEMRLKRAREQEAVVEKMARQRALEEAHEVAGD